jgi:hypothetical protein
MSETIRSLIATSVVLLIAGQPALSLDGPPPRPPRPLVSVLVGQPVTRAETIPASTQASVISTHYEDLIGQVLARPQPIGPPARQLEHGDDLVHGPGMVRLWEQSVSMWEAPAFCHRPLYFEDENLERHGRSFGLVQPAVSAAHFAGHGLVWPYLAGAFPPHECIYSLGRERPGSYAAYRLYRPPLSARGAAYQAAAVTGLSFVVP